MSSQNSGQSAGSGASGQVAKAHFGLTDIGNVDHGATDAVKYLFQAVGRTVVSSQYNTNVSCMVVEHARDMVKAVNECINDVENSSLATGDWDSFDKYSNAIDPLEDLLYKLLPLADEKIQHIPAKYTAGTDTSACVLSAETWAIERKEISEILENLYKEASLLNLLTVPDEAVRETNRKVAQKHDDETLLEEMKTKINAFFADDSTKTAFPHGHKIHTPLNTLQGTVISGSQDWALVTTIKTSMLIGGVMETAKATDDVKTWEHLKSEPVWDAALELINELESKKTDQAPSGSEIPDEVKTKYEAFVNIILQLADITLPASYVDLMKKVAHIRRPFQAQAITVVMLCHMLAVKFDTDKSAIDKGKYDSLKTAFNETLAALGDAITASTADKYRTINTSDFSNNDTVKAFVKAEGCIKGSFTSLGLTNWDNDGKGKLATAANNDKERLKKLDDKLKGLGSDTSEKVKVTVSKHATHDDSAAGSPIHVDEEGTMRLSALLWNVAGLFETDETQKKRARTVGKIYQKDDSGEWVEVKAHSKLEEIASAVASGGSGKEVTLRLVVPTA